MTKNRRIVQKIAGHGHIKMADGKRIGVVYTLTVFRTLSDQAVTNGLTSHLEVSGTIKIDEDHGMVDLSGKSFTLKTDDGRCLEAVARKGKPLSRQWEIMPSGPKGLEPC
jgi:hypothetical protein